jgi:uncharacterized protein involved in exopolysaccharide biosynthesis
MSSTKSGVVIPDNIGYRKSASDGDAGWNTLDLLVIFARNRRFIVIFTAVAAALAIVISLVVTKRYTAETSVLPPQQNSMSSALLSQFSGSAGPLASLAGGGLSSLGLKNSDAIYIAMLHSRTVEDEMVKQFDLLHRYKVKKMSDARKVFESNSKAEADTKDSLIHISVEAPSPQLAADMANTYVDDFRNLSATLAVTEAGQRRLFFENQLVDAKNKLEDAEEALKKAELTTGMIQPDNQSRAMIESAASIRGEIVGTQVQLQSMGSFATEDNPDVIVLKQRLAALQSQLQQLTGNSAADSNLFVPKGKIPEAALVYVRDLREVKYREVIFDAIARQLEMAKLDEARQGAVIQIMDPAIPPDKRSFPKRTIIVIAVTFLAFCIACAITLFREKVRSLHESEVEHQKLVELRNAFRLRRP